MFWRMCWCQHMKGFKYQEQVFGNQWRDLMTGVIGSCSFVCVMIGAALCWRSCRRWMSFFRKPKSKELQLSSLEDHKRVNKLFCSTWCQKLDDLSNYVDLAMRVKYYSQIFTWGLVKTVDSQTFIVEMLSFFSTDVEQVMTKSVFLPSSPVWRAGGRAVRNSAVTKKLTDFFFLLFFTDMTYLPG